MSRPLKHTYLCECPRRSCRQRFELDVDLYQRILAVGGKLVADGHQALWDRTIRRGDGWRAVLHGRAFQSQDARVRAARRRLQPRAGRVRGRGR